MPALALQMLPQAHAPWMTERPSEKGVSCGRSKYFKSFQLFWVPRKIFISNSTSRPSSANKPSCIATKSFNPMPFGATETLIVIEHLQPADKVTFVQLVVYCATLGRQGAHSDVDGALAAACLDVTRLRADLEIPVGDLLAHPEQDVAFGSDC